ALGVVGTVMALIRGPRVRLPLASLAGLVVFAVVGAVMAWPYLQVTAQHPYARRTEGDLALFSPPLRGFFVAPPESLVWGDLHARARAGLPWAPEMAMLPGFVLWGLAAAGVIFSVWTLRQRLLLALGVVASVVLAAGTSAPAGGQYTYLLLFRT